MFEDGILGWVKRSRHGRRNLWDPLSIESERKRRWKKCSATESEISLGRLEAERQMVRLKSTLTQSASMPIVAFELAKYAC